MDLFSQIETPEREEILTLRRELEYANHQYYVLNAPTMSDYEFDHKLRRLQDLEAAYPDMFDPKSPTQHVGSDLNSEKGKRKGEKGKDLSNWHIATLCYPCPTPIPKRR